jgi:hypothetical protein
MVCLSLGTKLPANWGQTLLRSLTTFDTSQIDAWSGLRIAILTMVPMVVGLATNQVAWGLIASLGTFNLSISQNPHSFSRPALRFLVVTSVVNASALGLGTLVGISGVFAIPLFGFGFFIAAFLAIYADAAIMGLTACVLFSIGVGLPGGGSVTAAEGRFLFSLAGGLLGLVGAMMHGLIASRTEKNKRHDQASANPSPITANAGSRQSYRDRLLKPVTANLSLRSEHLQFSLAFGIAGAAALAIALYLDVNRDYWVLLTLALLMLRSDISTALNFTVLRIIGTVIGSLAVSR